MTTMSLLLPILSTYIPICYLCVCDYDAHECFVRSFFLQQAKQKSVESCHSKHFVTPYSSIHLADLQE